MKHFPTWSLSVTVFALSVSLAACSSDMEVADANLVSSSEQQTTENPAFFPADDGTRPLRGSTASANLRLLLDAVEPSTFLNIEPLTITEAQYAEIKDEVDAKCVVPGDTYATFRNIFKWVTDSVQYAWSGYSSPDPYDVFINRTCICQGYANLLRVMLHTQGIPCAGVNGYIPNGAHAWNYVYAGDRWIVSDPTNGRNFEMDNLTDYQELLDPMSVDVPVLEDESFAYSFEDQMLTVTAVKQCQTDYLTVPFSACGYQVQSFCPKSPLPANVHELYIGENIRSLGEAYLGLTDNAPNVEYAYVDEASRYLRSYEGAVYERTATTPLYIPKSIKRVVLPGKFAIEKNTIVGLPEVEEIVFSEGTKRISSYAIEDCPNLKRVYVPETLVQIDENAIYNCGPDVEIISVPTGIDHVTM